ncbi:uncharacterized protein C2orf42-like [Anneissia japonica]|uniref:uncharacterized protein C2orf42-like n=1 Tax=Anneissia japonica TaxID=1529436 RepID=UPI001425ABCE|nr:uncharacterized protein C2orf42-like [Anneissia japonica]XP_033106760.1 uncharacterized protein C2orf42-like [Anneissia japonica]
MNISGAAKMDKKLAMFKDLGRPTLRGVKKCPNCGTYNGIRGLSCKNKACNMVLKGNGRKSGHSADAVKVITGSTVQVFSVRLRDRGPDYRGFVQLPLKQELAGQAHNVDAWNNLVSQSGRCFVETCQKPPVMVNQIQTLPPPCPHIRLALDCEEEATPLTLKNSVLNALPVSNEIKQSIWLLATETTGPLVQRVTKNVMVVKCKTNPKQPLGFLHFSFTSSNKKNGVTEHRFQCMCKQFKNFFKNLIGGEDQRRRCVHFYACICAFASEETLAKEFEYYIHLDTTGLEKLIPSDEQVLQAAAALEEDSAGVKRKRKDDTLVQASSALLTLHDSANSNAQLKRTPSKKVTPQASCSPAKQPTFLSVEGAIPVITFVDWLGSVTERVNQTMHFQFDGNPEPLVFHVPQVFFDCLQQRISAGSKKRRLPNSTTAFIRKDALPLGTFSKYTWHITSILHVKSIFDTPEMPLDITRSFVQDRDGKYLLYVTPKVEVETIAESFRKADGQVAIKPCELKTYLKVGNTSPDQREPTPFIIEWIPDILPKSKIGELRIKFEYGHLRNGHVEHRLTLPAEPVT